MINKGKAIHINWLFYSFFIYSLSPLCLATAQHSPVAKAEPQPPPASGPETRFHDNVTLVAGEEPSP